MYMRLDIMERFFTITAVIGHPWRAIRQVFYSQYGVCQPHRYTSRDILVQSCIIVDLSGQKWVQQLLKDWILSGEQAIPMYTQQEARGLSFILTVQPGQLKRVRWNLILRLSVLQQPTNSMPEEKAAWSWVTMVFRGTGSGPDLLTFFRMFGVLITTIFLL